MAKHTKSKFIMTAFSRRTVPTIACINAATDHHAIAFDRLIPALQIFLDDCFAPIWGTPAKLIKASAGVLNAWTLIFLDHADVNGDESYHRTTLDGLPLAKVFVKSSLASGDKVSVAASHELAEMLVDPAINLWADGPKGTLWAYEVCDPVEEEEFPVDGVAMSDFVFPTYFELFCAKHPNASQFDYRNKLQRPFQLLNGGYAEVRIGKKVKEIFGSMEKRQRFKNEDRRLHRSEYRRQRIEHATAS